MTPARPPLLDTLLVAGSPLALSSLLDSTLVTNYSQESLDIFYDASSKLTLRGGYRYVWGDAQYAFLPAAGLASSDQEQLRQNIGIGSATFRPIAENLADRRSGGRIVAAGFTSAPVFITIRRCGRRCTISRLQSLSVSGDFTLLDNQNPLAGTNYNYSSHQESLSFYWSPRNGKIFDIQGSYTRGDLVSNIGYLEPEDLVAASFALSSTTPIPRTALHRSGLAAWQTFCSETIGRRIVFHLLRQPAHQLLSAGRQALGAAGKARDAGSANGILRIRRSVLSL